MAALRPLAVVDLDGTVADVGHRLHHLSGGRRDWAAFFGGIPADPPLPTGVELARRLAADHEIVYLTGRPEYTRHSTERWLARHQLPRGRLVMRPSGERRPARVVKPRLLARLAGDRHVAVVIDDDPAVCDAFEAAGWPVERATWATTSAADGSVLAEAQERLGRT